MQEFINYVRLTFEKEVNCNKIIIIGTIGANILKETLLEVGM